MSAPTPAQVAALLQHARDEITDSREWLARRFHDSAHEAQERMRIRVWEDVIARLTEDRYLQS